MNKPEKIDPFFNIPKNKEGNPDFLWVAFQSFLSSHPDSWDGETLFKHIENDKFNMECSTQVSLWQPFIGFPKEQFLEAVLLVEDLHINSYLSGREDALVDTPHPQPVKRKSKQTK